MNGIGWTNGLCLRTLPVLLVSRRARRAISGMVTLRRAYEHVLVMAVLEGAGARREAFYDGYVDALEILGARAALIARNL